MNQDKMNIQRARKSIILAKIILKVNKLSSVEYSQLLEDLSNALNNTPEDIIDQNIEILNKIGV